MEKNIEILDVTFLIPAKIKVKYDDSEIDIICNIDIINRKVYADDSSESLSEYVFSYLDGINILPEDFFAAPQEVAEEAAKADADRERMMKNAIGEINE